MHKGLAVCIRQAQLNLEDHILGKWSLQPGNEAYTEIPSNTMDNIQGFEKEFCIQDLTSTGSLGFMAQRNRSSVAYSCLRDRFVVLDEADGLMKTHKKEHKNFQSVVKYLMIKRWHSMGKIEMPPHPPVLGLNDTDTGTWWASDRAKAIKN